MPADRAALTRHAAKNRDWWNAESDAYQERHGEQLATNAGLAWGVWQIPEAELVVLGEVAGRDVLELGCGAAQWSISLAKLGARPVGLDLSSRQLGHAREGLEAAGVDFPLIEASAESTPLDDDSFDIVFCDHGAFSFADPRLLVPECARLLRAGGLLAFNMVSPVFDIAYDLGAEDVAESFQNSYFDLEEFDAGDTTEFQLPFGRWIRLLRDNGFEIEDLIELRAPEGAESSYDLVSAEWARRWPAENIWKARKRG